MNLSSNSAAIVGCGSIGSMLADELARAGMGNLWLIDPDRFEGKNVARHVLLCPDVGRHKVACMHDHLLDIDQSLKIRVCAERFSALREKPDVICSCVDSLACDSLVNSYAIENRIPAVFAGVHGDAHTAEIITYEPGGPCFDCYEREGPGPEVTQDAYTDPSYDKTRMPSQVGLWGDVVIAASLQFQAVLGVLGAREKFPPLLLMSLRYPFTTEPYVKKSRCAVCSDDFSRLIV